MGRAELPAGLLCRLCGLVLTGNRRGRVVPIGEARDRRNRALGGRLAQGAAAGNLLFSNKSGSANAAVVETTRLAQPDLRTCDDAGSPPTRQ